MKNNLINSIKLSSALVISSSNVLIKLLSTPFCVLILVGTSLSVAMGQSEETAYFQQEVNYHIEVTLDTQARSLLVNGHFDYKNNAAQTLDHIYMHLWANAFKDKQSAYAQQQFEAGLYAFHFCKEEEMGGYTDLTMRQGDTQLKLEPYTDQQEGGKIHTDIAKMTLNKPLAPGQSVSIHFDYILDIPKAFDRLGYDGSLYRMTQWYPKPAVYDVEGWHPMPYLMLGEYYAEYGDYDIELHLPQEYSLAFTGKELRFEPCPNREGYMTTTIEAHRVLDFAWFASPDYNLQSKTIQIADQDIVLHLLSNYNEGQEKIFSYMEAAIRFYSAEVGLYPYPQYSLTLSQDASRGGMEYPMVSMVDHSHIGQNMDNLIAHEIGHNWFQSILGTNERDHPWLDEGLNSYYERAYDRSRYVIENNRIFPKFMRPRVGEISDMQGGVGHLYCCGRLSAIDQKSNDMDVITYVTNSYERTAWSLQYLESYLGAEMLHRGMRAYYNQWQFKHPQPQDFRAALETASGKNLNWFFDGIIKENKSFDYSFKSVKTKHGKYAIQLQNKGPLAIPVCLNAYTKVSKQELDQELDQEIGNEISNGIDHDIGHEMAHQRGKEKGGNGVKQKGQDRGRQSTLVFDNNNPRLVHSQWVEPAGQAEPIYLPAEAYSRISINGALPFLDSDRTNNHYYTDKLRSRRPRTDLHFGPRVGDSQTNIVSILPALNCNNYDGLALGMLMFSDFYPFKKTRWYAQPVLGLRSKAVVGAFGLERDIVWHESSSFRKITAGIAGRRYHMSDEILMPMSDQSARLSYSKLTFKLGIDFRSGMTTEHHLTYRLMRLDVESFNFNDIEPKLSNPSFIHQLTYYKESPTRLGVQQLLIQGEYENYKSIFSDSKKQYLKLSVDYNKTIHYSADHKFYFRFFGGYFPLNTERARASYGNRESRGSIALTQQGYTDHTFEGSYFGRSDQTGLYSQQISIEEGGFKMPAGSRFSYLGMSNDYAATINMKIDLPFKYNSLNLRPFVDAGIMNTKAVTNDPLDLEFYYSGGVAFEIGEVFSLYLPLVYSSQFDIPYSGRNLLDKISLRFNLKKWNPWKVSQHPGSLLYL